MKTAKAKQPLPYMFICAFIANAASFVLPISNPANLVIYGSPHAAAAALAAAIRATIRALGPCHVSCPPLVPAQRSETGDLFCHHRPGAGPWVGRRQRLASGMTAIVLLVSSGFDIQLGLPTILAGLATAILVLVRSQNQSYGGGEEHLVGCAATRGRIVRAGGSPWKRRE